MFGPPTQKQKASKPKQQKKLSAETEAERPKYRFHDCTSKDELHKR